jgi:hypothetical protein
MSWVKLDTGIFRNPKVVTIGADAKLLYIAGICYAGDNLTDGLIPNNAIPILGAEANVKNTKRATAELVAAGLWIPFAAGFEVHDYLKHNSRSHDVQSKRDAAKERMQQARSQYVRENKARTNDEQNAKFAKSSPSIEGRRKKVEQEKETIAAKPPAPLPENGPSQQIVKAFCDAIGIERPVNYSKSVGQAKQLAVAGITAEQIPDIVSWLRDQKWVNGAIDLGLIVNQADKWQAASKPVSRDGQSREARDGILVY